MTAIDPKRARYFLVAYMTTVGGLSYGKIFVQTDEKTSKAWVDKTTAEICAQHEGWTAENTLITGFCELESGEGFFSFEGI